MYCLVGFGNFYATITAHKQELKISLISNQYFNRIIPDVGYTILWLDRFYPKFTTIFKIE